MRNNVLFLFSITLLLGIACEKSADKIVADNIPWGEGTISVEPRAALGEEMEEPDPVSPKVPSYPLPITDIAQILNFERDIAGTAKVTLSDDQQALLLANGFVVLPGNATTFDADYIALQGDSWDAESYVPIFVSTGSVIHLYHLYFEQMLKYLEVKYLIGDLKALSLALMAESDKLAWDDPQMEEAAKLLKGYLSVVVSLIDDDFKPGAAVEKMVKKELALIDGHEKISPSEVFTNNCPLYATTPNFCDGTIGPEEWAALTRKQECYCEDFSQYIPRGHYTQSEELTRYFKAMMYFGRMAFLIKNDRPTLAALLLTSLLRDAPTADGRTAQEAWGRIYRTTAFFAGNADDLLPTEYDNAFRSLFGAEGTIAALSDAAEMEKFVEKVMTLRAPGILGGFKNGLLDSRTETTGLRIMGQRFAPDSYVLGETVGDNAGIDTTDPDKEEILKKAAGQLPECNDIETKDPTLFDNSEMYCACGAAIYFGNKTFCRLLPSGLDVMTAMGSSAALRIQTARDYKYAKLAATHERLITEFAAYTAKDYSQNAYWGWLSILRPLIADRSEGWPTAMRTDAWHDFSLNTALSGWSELRHDTILYVKQSYTEQYDVTVADDGGGPQAKQFYGYIEPEPLFYGRVARMTEMLKVGLRGMGFTDKEFLNALDAGITFMEKLETMARTELNNDDLTENDLFYIRNIGTVFNALIKQLAAAITVETNECKDRYCSSETNLAYDPDKNPYDVRLVADVHTDVNFQEVLETATAKLDRIIVVRRMTDGTLGASVGPVFSYREFPWEMNDRLTDEKWRGTVLAGDAAAGLPDWSASFRK